jgi:predicted enzyme related to lactoylglutathione lyase
MNCRRKRRKSKQLPVDKKGGARMPKYSYHHIHLTSPDPAKTAQFYEDMFDAERARTTELPNGSVTVDLNLDADGAWHDKRA